MNFTGLSTVQQVFDQFNLQFPFLRLELYAHGHEGAKGSKPDDQVSHETTLNQLNPDIEDNTFDILPEMTVAEFEKFMKEKYSLNIQVFRKSADIWLQTSATDHWTLEKQNGKGQRSTLEYVIPPIDITDFDLE